MYIILYNNIYFFIFKKKSNNIYIYIYISVYFFVDILKICYTYYLNFHLNTLKKFFLNIINKF